MKILLFFAGFLLLIGCGASPDGKKPSERDAENVDNAATRYVDSLHTSVHRARGAAEQAEQANETTESQINELNSQQ